MNAPPPAKSWLPDEEDSLMLARQILTGVSMFFGPAGPVLVAAGEFVFRRRHLLFGTNGRPLRAVGLMGGPPPARTAAGLLDATATLGGLGTRKQVLSVVPELDSPARRSGLRNGDPVSLLLAGSTGTVQRNGLVVPARIGQRLDVTVPRGEYTIAGMGASRDTLFTTRDPIRAAGGLRLRAGTHPTASLALQARSALAPPTSRVTPCRWCNRIVSNLHLITHEFLYCPRRPRPYRCETCGEGFDTEGARRMHRYQEHIAPTQARLRAEAGQASCPHCGNTYFLGALHMLTCPSAPRPYACATCTATFTTHTELVAHRRQRHPWRLAV